MPSFRIDDEDKGIETRYWVYLQGVSIDFNSSSTGSKTKIYKENKYLGKGGVVKGRRIWVGPRSLEWVPAAPCFMDNDEDILVQYGEGDDGPSHTSDIAGWQDVEALALGAEYQYGSACLEIKRDFRCGASTVRLFVRKVHEYYKARSFTLSVVIENIRRDERNKLVEYQQYIEKKLHDSIVDNIPYTFRGNERVIETPESPWQDDRGDVTNNLRHVAVESLPLLLKYLDAQSAAIERGLSLDDFLWEYPNHHETRVVRPPSAHTDTSLRAIRLDITIYTPTYGSNPLVNLYISSIELKITTMTRSPSLPNILHNTTFHLDARYAALANATISNHSSQITEIDTGSQSAERIITTSSSIHFNGTLIMGDMFAAPIYGGNVGGQNNTNHFTAPLTAEAVVSAVQRALDTRIGDGGRFVPQIEAGRKRKRDDEEAIEDIEGPSERRFRPMSFISRFCAALFSP